VDPEQCFFELRALSHQVVPGVRATCTMEGASWEMEDHRNWLDASFKTYVRPLALPHPYTIAGGSTVTQTVTFSFAGTKPAALRRSPELPATVALGRDSGGRMPLIGLRAPLAWMDQAFAVAELIRRAGAQLINGRIDLRLGHGVDEIERL